MRLRFIALLLLLLPLAMPAQTVPFYDINVRTATGAPYTGPVTICPVAAPIVRPSGVEAGPAAAYRLGGGGTVIASCQSVQATAGAFSTSLPDSWMTMPLHACFSVSAQDPVLFTENLPGYVCVQPSVQPGSPAIKTGWCNASTGCDLGKLAPSLPTVAPILAGPPGAQGVQGIPGNAGTLATPAVAGVVYLPAGGTSTTLSPLALSGMAGDLVGLGTAAPSTLPYSADGTTGGINGVQETFFADGCGVNGAIPSAWNFAASGIGCSQGALYPASGSRVLAQHELHLSGGLFPTAGTWGLQQEVYYAHGGNAQNFGFDSEPLGTDNEANGNVGAVVGNGFGYTVNGSVTYTLPKGGQAAGSGVIGSTDSGFNGLGWGDSPAGFYDASVLLPGDGTMILSFMRYGSLKSAAAFRVPVTIPTCATPCGPRGAAATLTNIHEVISNPSLDRVSVVSAAAGGSRTIGYDIPHIPGRRNLAVLLPAYLNSAGKDCHYDGSSPSSYGQIGTNAAGNPGTAVTSSGCFHAWAYVSPAYNPQGPNRAVIMLHGYNQSAITQVYNFNVGGTGDVADTLSEQGYVIINMDNTVANCYGNAQCVADVANVYAYFRAALNLDPYPFLIADSLGGLQLFNAVSHGVVTPRAIVCYSCNTSLALKRTGDAGNIGPDYGYTVDQQYPTATSSYDPLLVAQGQDATLSAANARVMQARLAATHTLFIADPSDPTVDTNANSTYLYTALNAIHPGAATVDFNHNGQGHVGAGLMNAAQVVAFFNQY